MRHCIKKQLYVGLFLLMLSCIIPAFQSPAFALSNSDFEAMVKKAEERRVAIAQMMEASTVFIISENDGNSFGMGTGFLIQEGYVLTNAHVVDDYSKFFIAGKSFAPIQAKLIKKVHTQVDDFALLQFAQPTDLPILSFSLSLSRTDKISAWGYPYLVTQFDENMDKIIAGEYANLPPVVYTEGVVSAFVESNGGQAIIHSAAIASGNSGGPLINSQGQVVGVNTWGASIEGDDAFVNASQPSHAAIRFLRECGIEPTIAASNGPVLTMQSAGQSGTQAAKPLHTGTTSSSGKLPSYLQGNGEGWSTSQVADSTPKPSANHPSEQAAAQLTGDAKEMYPAALEGDAEAQAYVGISYYLGDEAPQLADEAFYWLQKSAAQNNASGMYMLGVMYVEHEDYKNPTEGLELIRKSVALEPAYAATLADFLLRGEAYGIPRNLEEGVAAAELGIKAGDAEAMGVLAYAYATGNGVARDEAHAFELATEAAEAGDAFAHAVLGMLHCTSETLEENLPAALEHAKIAAEEGIDMGNGLMAVLYIIEMLPDMDVTTAIEYAEDAAQCNDELGHWAMALFCLDEDYGYEVDLPLAWAHFEMASRRNLSLAVELRDELASVLSEEDLALGKQYIDLWHKDWGLK